MTIKPATHPGIDRVKRVMFLKYPAMGALLAGRKTLWESDESGVTAYTDGSIIVFGTAFFNNLRPAQQLFLVGHELLHIYLLHCVRMRQYQLHGLHGRPYNHDLGNIVMDVLINEALIYDLFGEFIDSGWDTRKLTSVFPGVLVDLNETFEALYKKCMDIVLAQQQPDGESGDGNSTPKSGQGAPQPGQGGSDPAQPGQGAGDPLAEALDGMSTGPLSGDVQPNKPPGNGGEDIAPGNTLPAPLTPSEVMATAQQANAIAKARGHGRGSALSRLVEAAYEPWIDWKEMLVTEASRRFGEGKKDWRYPKARPLIQQGVYYPRKTTMVAGKLAVGIDTSASVGTPELVEFMGIMGDMVEQTTPEHIDVVWCDYAIQRIDTLEQPQDSSEATELFTRDGVPGRGGTKFDPVFEWVAEQMRNGAEAPAVLIYMTDGECSFPDQPPYPVIWCITSKTIKAPWGLTIPVILKS